MYNITINTNNYDIVPKNGQNHARTVNGNAYEIDMAQKDATSWEVTKGGVKIAPFRINWRKYTLKISRSV